MLEGKGLTSLFCMWISSFLKEKRKKPIEKTVLSPLDALGTLVENHLRIHVKAYFRAQFSILLVNMSLIMLIPHCLITL